MRSPFKANRQGVKVSLGEAELDLLGGLVAFLEEVAAADRNDPAHARLNVAAYPDDPAAQTEYGETAGPMLADLRAGHQMLFAQGLEAVAGGEPLTMEQAEAWLTVIGDSRLALAARLGITDAGWSEQPSVDPARATLDYLSFLQDRLVAALVKKL